MKQVVLCPTLVGREEELETLLRGLEAARTGSGSLALVLGEAGIGKSRLAREVAAEARRQGLPVLVGRATQGDSPVPFRPLAEAFLSYIRVSGLPDTRELQPFLPALGRLVPPWRQHHTAGSDDSTVVLGEAVLRLLRVIAGHTGCLLLLEDLHWADPETLAVVEYLADNLQHEPVLCIATLRGEEVTPAVRLARSIQGRRTGLTIELDRLSNVEVERMAQACLDETPLPDAVTRLLASYADGVPLLVEDLLAASIETGALASGDSPREGPPRPAVPRTFAQSVHDRTQRLDPPARRVLEAAALLGRHFEWILLPEITGLQENAVLAGLRRAVEAQLILVEGTDERSRFRFRHALTRDAILAELLPPERARLSRRALDALRAAHPHLPGEWCELGAELARATGDRRQAAALLLEAGRRALAQGALTTAEGTLDRAARLDLDDPLLLAEIEETLVEVLALAGKTDRVFEVGGDLLRALGVIQAPAERRAQAHLMLARAAATANQWETAEDQLERARGWALESPGRDLLPRIDAVAAHTAMGAHRPEEASALARAALESAEREGLPEVACEALEVIGRSARLRDLHAAEASFEQARAIAEEHGLTIWQVRALLELGTIDLLSGAPLDRLRRTRDLGMRIGALATVCVIDLQIAAGSIMFGKCAEGLATALRSADIARRFHLNPLLGMNLTLAAEVYCFERRFPEMDEALMEALAVAGDHPDVIVSVHAERANRALLEEDRCGAMDELARAMDVVRRSPSMSPHPCRGLWALVSVVEGVEAEAACAELEASGATVQRVNRGFLNYAEAVLLGRQRRREEAEAAFDRADADMRDMPWYRRLSRRLVAEAAIADGWGDPVGWLRDAITFFEEEGHDRVVSACRQLLRRAGAPLPRRGRGEARVPPDLRTLGVTSREMDVLLLLARGISNREIGERLFLSPRTVERHVENLTHKTGTQGRTQLVAFAARHVGEDSSP